MVVNLFVLLNWALTIFRRNKLYGASINFTYRQIMYPNMFHGTWRGESRIPGKLWGTQYSNNFVTSKKN